MTYLGHAPGRCQRQGFVLHLLRPFLAVLIDPDGKIMNEILLRARKSEIWSCINLQVSVAWWECWR